MTREDINDIINAICPNDEDYEKPCISPKYLRQELEQLALDQEQYYSESNCSEIPTGSTTKNNLAVDCISREDALDCVNWGYSFSDIYKKINELPSVTPQEPKTGHWIKGYTFPDGAYWKCDKCNELIKVKIPMRYCNNCGADMREVKE